MSDEVEKAELQQMWGVYLLEYEFAKHYAHPYAVYAHKLVKNPILEMLLPSLLFIRVVSILDEALQFELEVQGITLSKGNYKKYKNDLYGRIEFLSKEQRLIESSKLHELRDRRNDIAHDCEKSASWDELSKAVDLVEVNLQKLTIVGSRPKLEFYGKGSAIKKSSEPDVIFERDFEFGIKENGKHALGWAYTEKMHKS